MEKKTKLMAVLVSTVAALLVFTGVVYAADAAIPGDTLYGFDRALESAGLGDGGLEERLGEAGALIDKGEVNEGFAHAAEALAEQEEDLDGDGDGELSEEEGLVRSEALMVAAEAVLLKGSEQSLVVRSSVAEELRWMATTELTGKEFGQAVSDLARGILNNGQEEEGSADDDAAHPNNVKGKSKDKSNNGKAINHRK